VQAGTLLLCLLMAGSAGAQEVERSIAGSIQLDYLSVPTDRPSRDLGLDAMTVELSLKMAVDFNDHASASVKMCYACHGLEVGMAFIDLRYRDELSFRVGRFTPSFGNFPVRHDPANHRTSDKPLPYDMGRMLRLQEWNMSVLPAPWVDNGIEVGGTHFFGDSARLDYAAYVISGPKARADDADFNFIESRSRERYYVDNNSEPVGGARIAASFDVGEEGSLSAGLSGMAGHYDPEAELGFALFGVDLVAMYKGAFLRAEYLIRGTEMPLGDNPSKRFKYAANDDGEFDDIFLKDGFYVEAQVPVGRIDFIARWDGMRRFGNVLANSPLRSKSIVLRYTGALAVELFSGIRLKSSLEVYDFSDFEDEIAVHLGLATPF
jgi:hypothetical protein